PWPSRFRYPISATTPRIRLSAAKKRSVTSGSQEPRALLEVGEQGLVERSAGVELDVVDAILAALPAILLAPGVEPLAVAPRDLPGLGGEALAGLHVDEGRGIGVRELALVGIEDVEHHHLVVAMAEVLEALQHLGGPVHEIGAQDHQPAAADALGQLVERRAEARAS